MPTPEDSENYVTRAEFQQLLATTDERHIENIASIKEVVSAVTTLTGKLTDIVASIQLQLAENKSQVSNLKTVVDLSIKYIVPMVVGIVSLFIGLTAGRAGY